MCERDYDLHEFQMPMVKAKANKKKKIFKNLKHHIRNVMSALAERKFCAVNIELCCSTNSNKPIGGLKCSNRIIESQDLDRHANACTDLLFIHMWHFDRFAFALVEIRFLYDISRLLASHHSVQYLPFICGLDTRFVRTIHAPHSCWQSHISIWKCDESSDASKWR